MTQSRYLITSALPYVNNIPHLGNLICIISADVYARYLRLQKRNIISVIGTDEHGTTTETKARQEGLTPKEITDKYFKIHKEIYEWFNTSFDCLGRSSSQENIEISQDIFLKLHKNGFIIAKTVKQFYDEEKQTFLADRFLEGTCPYCGFERAKGDQCDHCGKLLESEDLKNPVSVLSKTKPVLKETEHLYIDLPKLEPLLKDWMSTREQSWSENARTITHAWLKEQLHPRAITRDLKWGVQVPLKEYENKVFYSWFDAPIGYIGITKECKSDWHDWWHNNKEVKLVQFMGKDNTQFHTILFPAFLLGAKDEYTLLDTISVNEYLNYAGGKFSKSRHIGVFGDDAIKTGISADAYRYYLTAIRPEKEDTTFDWEDFRQKVNRELVDNFANLVNRGISFTNRFFDGKVPRITNDDCQLSFKEIEECYEKHEQKQALKLIMQISKQLNQYFQDNKPWETIKTDKQKAANTLAILLNRIQDVTIALFPVIPKIAEEVFTQLNVTTNTWADIGKISLAENHQLNKEKALLHKLDEEKIKQLKKQFNGNTQDNVFPLDLKVAQITKVEEIPETDSLYVLQLDVGDEKRQIVSGLKAYYDADELLNRKIILVSNLKPANLKGYKSNGMLLAGESKEIPCKLLEVKFAKPGEQVAPEGYTINSKQITFNEFKKLKIIVQDKAVLFNKKPLKTAKEHVACPMGKGIVT